MPETTTIQTTTRAAGLEDLVTLLRDHHARKIDVVARPQHLTASQGRLVVAGTEVELTDDGVTSLDGVYLPTRVADDGIASRLGIPPAYLRRTRDQAIDIWDHNVNGWLSHPSNADKKYLVRGLRGDDGGTGVARAFLSDSFKPVDNLDVLMTALEGVRDAGLAVEIPQGGCDLSEKRMYVKLWAPAVKALAPVLLANYQSPWGIDAERGRRMAQAEGLGYDEGTEPVVFAGFVLKNSEVGLGKFEIAPQVVVRICKNGLTIQAEAFTMQHLGVKLDEGVVKFSSDTIEKQLAVVRAKVRDAVRTFLDPGYLEHKVRQMEQSATTPVDDPNATVEFVATKLKYDEGRQADILRHFLLGRQMTAGGVMQAVTSVAQTVADADDAAQMEADGLQAMELAASFA